MLKKPLTHLFIAAGIAVLTAGCVVDAQSVAATGSFDRTLSVSGNVSLHVQTGSGSIQIRRGGTGQVQIAGRIRAQRGFWNNVSAEERVRRIEANPPIVQSGNAVRVGEQADDDLFRNVSISYDITVPADTRVELRSGSGSQQVDAVRGPVDARSGSGSLHIGQVDGSVEANTGSGSIDVLGAGGGLTASTGSGSIHARQIVGRVNASSGSGRIEIAFAGPGDAEIGTGSGGIRIDGASGALRAHAGSGSIVVEGRSTGNWSIETGSGSITVRLPQNAAFDLDARSNSGSVTTSHPIEVVGTLSKRHLQGRVRGGGPSVRVAAGSGSIRLE